MPSPLEIHDDLPTDRELYDTNNTTPNNLRRNLVADDNNGQEIFARKSGGIKNYDNELPSNCIPQQQQFDLSNNVIITNRYTNVQENLNSFPKQTVPFKMTMHRDSLRLPSSSITQSAQSMVNSTTSNSNNRNNSNEASIFGVGQKGMKDLVASAGKFPMKLMVVLSIEEFEPIISWDALGVSFTIHDADRLSKEVLPKIFKGTKYSSFLRKLYRWGFAKRREMSGKTVRDLSYSNPRFRRGNIDLCKTILCECDESDRADVAAKLHHEIGASTQRSPNAQEKAASMATGMIGDRLNGEQAMMMQSNMASHSLTILPNNSNTNMMIMNRDGLNDEKEVYYMVPLSSINRDGLNGQQAMMMQSNMAPNSSAMLPNNNMNMMIMNRDGLNGQQAMLMPSNMAPNSSAMLPNNNMNMMIMNRDGLNGQQAMMMPSNMAPNSSAMLPNNNTNMLIMNRDGLNGEEVYYMMQSNSSAKSHNNNMAMASRVMPRSSIQYQPGRTFNGQSFTVGQKTRLAHSMPALPVQVPRPYLEQPIQPMQTMQNTLAPPFERRNLEERSNGQQMNMQQRQENTDPNFE